MIPVVKIFGDLFVKALKGVAPVLVFFLVMNAMAQKKESKENSIQPIIELYMIATFCASLVGVGMSFLFPTTLNLTVAPDAKLAPPSGIVEVLHTLILSIVDNPVSALMNANYIGILAWAVILGIALRSVAGDVTRTCLNDIAAAITKWWAGSSILRPWALWAWWPIPSEARGWKPFWAMPSFWECSSFPMVW